MTDNEQQFSDEKFQELFGNVSNLPTLPVVVTQLVGLVEDPETTAKDVNRIITQDPSLTAKVLKIVNSAFYGFSREISTVTEAVVILGFDAIKSLALSASVLDVFSSKSVPGFDMVGLWKHSIATGIGAELVARWDRYPNPEEVLVSGILHNIGKMLLDLAAPGELRQILSYAEENQCSMYEAELETLGTGHPEIGAWLTKTWNLPENIVNGIRYYRSPMKAPEEYRQLPLFIHVGDVMARVKDVGWSGDNKAPDFQEEVWRVLDIDEEDIEMLLGKMEKNIDKAEELIKLVIDSERSD